jgi:hypothetical protein
MQAVFIFRASPPTTICLCLRVVLIRLAGTAGSTNSVPNDSERFTCRKLDHETSYSEQIAIPGQGEGTVGRHREP